MAAANQGFSDYVKGVPLFCKRIAVYFLLAWFLTACGDEERGKLLDQAEGAGKKIEENLAATRKALTDHTLRQAGILENYADILLADRPELQGVVSTLKSEATPDSPRLARFQERLEEARAAFDTTSDATAYSQALAAIAEESAPAAYDASLVDSINLLADLSNGKLSRIQPPAPTGSPAPGQTTAAASTGQGVGSQFVGNPNYGQWVQNSGGEWVWNFIGAYAALGAVNQGLQLLNYKDWNSNRGSSYYSNSRRSPWQYQPTRSNWTSSSKKSYSDLSQQRRQSSFGSSSASSASSPASADTGRRKSSFFSSTSGSSTPSKSTPSPAAKSGSTSSYSSPASSSSSSSSGSSSRTSSYSSSSGSSSKSSSYSSGFRSSSSSSSRSSSGGRFGGK